MASEQLSVPSPPVAATRSGSSGSVTSATSRSRSRSSSSSTGSSTMLGGTTAAAAAAARRSSGDPPPGSYGNGHHAAAVVEPALSVAGTDRGESSGESDDDDYDDHRVVQTDPSGRFQCWDICLGKGAFKEVYKAFDQEEGVEVAWNQLRTDYMSKKDVHKIFGEVKLLKLLHHDNIINFFHVWTAKGPDGRERVYFITELMSSGTLKSFIRKTKGRLKPKVVKNLCRHILRGLAYLHSRDPPIIHRDLKCDNIFINGNNGIAKIGDLGLATIKNKEHISSVLGTPEFMAPELYDERYDERVDIYAFGMCVLELVTKEYPYQECTNQAQIYKRVTTGVKPLALTKVTDPETREFIDLCIQHDYRLRPSAAQLLDHPFLAVTLAATSSEPASLSGSFVGLAPGADSPLAAAGSPDVGTGASTTPAASGAATPVQPPPPAPPAAIVVDPATESLLSPVPPLSLTIDVSAPPPPPPLVAGEDGTPSSLPAHLQHPDSPPPPGTPEGTFRTHAEGDRDTFHLTMQVTALDLAEFTLTLKMAMWCGSEPTKREVKFPFHLVYDTVAEIVGEMLREGVIHEDLTPSERAEMATMMRHVVYGDEVSEMVLDGANGIARDDEVSGVGEVVVDPALFEAWIAVMQRERALLDDEERSASEAEEDEDEDDEDEEEEEDEHAEFALPPLSPPRHDAPEAGADDEFDPHVLTSAVPDPEPADPPDHDDDDDADSDPTNLPPTPPESSEPPQPQPDAPATASSADAVARASPTPRSLEGSGILDRACPGEGAYVSQFRRGLQSQTSTPTTATASPDLAAAPPVPPLPAATAANAVFQLPPSSMPAPVPAAPAAVPVPAPTATIAPAPVASSAPTSDLIARAASVTLPPLVRSNSVGGAAGSVAQQETLLRTLTELQSLALSGFDEDGKRIGSASGSANASASSLSLAAAKPMSASGSTTALPAPLLPTPAASFPAATVSPVPFVSVPVPAAAGMVPLTPLTPRHPPMTPTASAAARVLGTSPPHAQAQPHAPMSVSDLMCDAAVHGDEWPPLAPTPAAPAPVVLHHHPTTPPATTVNAGVFAPLAVPVPPPPANP
ncbi:hypothetical protein H9P43_002069 [Blastocladiella emersonii ATCC 22665]|nr:hypothetical protein H9P43_002069 [Blastocladiella emersonii ATCC 22665]